MAPPRAANCSSFPSDHGRKYYVRVIKLQGVNNVRDIGGTPIQGGRAVKPGLFYRGGALSAPTRNDCDLLFNALGIRCVIDVRTGWEREDKPDVDVPGVENLHIPFYDLEKVGIEYTEPDAGTKVIGRDVACEPSSFYRSLTNPLTVGQMRKGLDASFSRTMRGEPVYHHCNGGKDRVGVLTLLILTALGASREAILEDYLYTNVSRDKRYQEMFERFLRLSDGDKERAHELVVSHRALPENLDAFYDAVENAYGNMDAFIRNQLGISDELRAQLREACTL